MRCPTCLYEGKSHSVHTVGRFGDNGTLPCEVYWDEHEQAHVHDPTLKFGLLKCSNGHEWKVEHITRCPQSDCEWNISPATRNQISALIPGRQESIADFRCRKISQFLRIRKLIPLLRLENCGVFFGEFIAVLNDPMGGFIAPSPTLVFGQLPYPQQRFIDLTDREIIAFFNGDYDG